MSSPVGILARPLRSIRRSRISQLRSNHTTPTPTPPKASPLKSSRVQRYLPRLQDLSKRTGVPLSSLAISFLVLHELTAVLPVIGFYFLFSSLGTGLGIIEWLDRTTTPSVEGQEQEGNGGGEGGWKGVVKGWYDEGQGKVGRVGRRYGLWQDGNLDIDDGGSSKVASKAGEGVANAVAAYVVVKVCPPIDINMRYAHHTGITTSKNRSVTRRSTNIRQMGFGTHTESRDEVDTQERCIAYSYA
jgi:hypothetical protein